MVKEVNNLFSEQDTWFTNLFDGAIDGMIIINSQGKILEANQAVKRIFGYTKEEIIGQNVSILMPSHHAKKHDSYVRNYELTHRPQVIGIGRTAEGLHKDGHIFPVRLAVKEANINDTHVYIGTIHNLSELQQANLEINKLNEELTKKVTARTYELEKVINELLKTNRKMLQEVEDRKKTEQKLRISEKNLKESLDKEIELNNLKTRFLSMASHEFKTPLSTILSSASIINRYTNTEDHANRKRHIDKIQASVNHLNSVLNDFISLSRLESSSITTTIKSYNLEEIIKNVIDEMQPEESDDNRIKLEVIKTPRLINTDEHLIKGILYNLISNAIKYSNGDEEIHVIIEFANPVRIIVKDFGIGIPDKEQALLFSRFFRASNVSAVRGTGLGLSIVKHYTDLLQGKIYFESKEDHGTTFFIELPYIESKSHEA